jgi:hypothetical protein
MWERIHAEDSPVEAVSFFIDSRLNPFIEHQSLEAMAHEA